MDGEVRLPWHQNDCDDAYDTGNKRPFAVLGDGIANMSKKLCVQHDYDDAITDDSAAITYEPRFVQNQDLNSMQVGIIGDSNGIHELQEDRPEPMQSVWTQNDPMKNIIDDLWTLASGSKLDGVCEGCDKDWAGGHSHAFIDIPSSPSSCSNKTRSPADSSQSSTSVLSEHMDTEKSKNFEGQNQILDTIVPTCATGKQAAEEPCPQPETLEPEYDTCFGALTEAIKTSQTKRDDHNGTSIELRPSGNILTLHLEDSGKYIGILNSVVLVQLLSESKIAVRATLVSPGTGNQKQSSGTKKSDSIPSSYFARMVIYGKSKDKNDIADMLSDAGLYLQQPSIDECDRDVVYDNPQFLVRPGSQMPLLNSSSTISDAVDETTAGSLHETKRNHLMRILDSAGNVRLSASSATSPRIASVLKEHQRTAVAFMLEKECGFVEEQKFPSLWKLANRSTGTFKKYRHVITGAFEDKPRLTNGGILADEMGLGKSLSLLALVCTSLDALQIPNVSLSSSETKQTFTTLIVAPKSTIPGWKAQVEMHVHPGQLKVDIYHGSQRTTRLRVVEDSNVVITTYETLRSDWEKSGPLFSQKWYRVVLDEAHHIRNRSSQIFSASCALRCQFRWCLTGTPIHNSLDDYGALLAFVGVSPFLHRSTFNTWITSVIDNDKPEGLDRLRKLIEATCLRRTKAMVNKSCQLPERVETVQFVDLSQDDRKLYEFFRDKTAKAASGKTEPATILGNASDSKGQPKIIALINILRLICNHGERLLPASAVEAWRSQSITTNWQTIRSSVLNCRLCGTEVDQSGSQIQDIDISSNSSATCDDCALESGVLTDDDAAASSDSGMIDSSSSSCPYSFRPELLQNSAKVRALLQNLTRLRQANHISDSLAPEKSVVFSFWTKMLDLVQQALQAQGFGFQRIDGRTSLEARSRAISTFNSNPSCTIMLASIGSTGEGVDLKVANNVHIIEPHWNPMVEAQAVDRVHRIGQNRNVRVIRYVVNDSVETYVRWLQLDKIKLINRSVDTTTTQQQQDLNEKRWNKLKETLQSRRNKEDL